MMYSGKKVGRLDMYSYLSQGPCPGSFSRFLVIFYPIPLSPRTLQKFVFNVFPFTFISVTYRVGPVKILK